MTLENSSLLGNIFIISGIAMAILAYAIYLNLKEKQPKLKPEERDETLDKKMDTPPSEQAVSTPETPLIETPFSLALGKDPTSIEETLQETQVELKDVEISGVDMPQQQELVPVVTVLREIDSGNIVLRIGETDYHNLDELMDSPHLPRIMRLSTDLDQWLTPTQKSDGKAERIVLQSKAAETELFGPKSMVDEINEILERMLKEEAGKRKAIKLVEMLDGGVNVYIGVDSYPIDEVPFEDVRQLIRKAVSEWEQR
jgi:hypothetical protein